MKHFQYTIQELCCTVSTQEYLSKCVDIPRFLGYCRQCRNYDKLWSCPPYQSSPMAIWQSYHSITIYGRMLRPTRSGQAASAALEALRQEKARQTDRLLQLEQGQRGSLALAPGACECCARCAKEDLGPCRHPERMRYSLEALGADVERTAVEYLGEKILWIRQGVVPAHLMLVGALLFCNSKEKTV